MNFYRIFVKRNNPRLSLFYTPNKLVISIVIIMMKIFQRSAGTADNPFVLPYQLFCFAVLYL